MIHADISISGDVLKSTHELLAHIDKGAEKAIAHALNRVAVGARFEIVKAIGEKHEIRARDVRNAIKIKRASYNKLQAQVDSTGTVIPLEDFKHSPSGYNQPRPKIGIRVKVRKDRSGGVIPGTFFIPNNPHIFQRETEDPRSKLLKMYGPAIPSMMRVVLDEEGEQGIQDRAEARLEREIQHEIDYLLMNGAK